MKKTDLHIADEEHLIKCCKNNDAQAQKLLYSMHVESMMIVCLRYVVNPEDAREVLMDGFFNFFKNIDRFTYMGIGSPRAWLKKIVVNQCLMHLRKKQPFYVNSKDPELYDAPDVSENALDQLTVKEILRLVHDLPDGYRAVFNLYVFEGKNHKEIGALLDISESTSKTQLHRARALLKEKLVPIS